MSSSRGHSSTEDVQKIQKMESPRSHHTNEKLAHYTKRIGIESANSFCCKKPGGEGHPGDNTMLGEYSI